MRTYQLINRTTLHSFPISEPMTLRKKRKQNVRTWAYSIWYVDLKRSRIVVPMSLRIVDAMPSQRLRGFGMKFLQRSLIKCMHSDLYPVSFIIWYVVWSGFSPGTSSCRLRPGLCPAPVCRRPRSSLQKGSGSAESPESLRPSAGRSRSMWVLLIFQTRPSRCIRPRWGLLSFSAGSVLP